MRIYPEITLEERLTIAQRSSIRIESIVTLYSDEGIFDMDTKIRKRVITDAPCREETVQGRNYTIDPSTSHHAEVWQIPYPNYREAKTLTYYATETEGGFLVAEHTPVGMVYYFVGETMETVVAQLQRFVSTDFLAPLPKRKRAAKTTANDGTNGPAAMRGKDVE